jgi:tRNA-uridine 2-sulfurtransferase
LSARFFNPTIPEKEGWVDREKLPAISGRSRKEQMQLAEQLEVTNYPCPAGGCLLTEPSFVPKIRDVFDHSDELNPRDFRLLKIGRHFRIGPRTKVIIGRNEAENLTLQNAIQQGEAAMRWLGGGSPLGVVTGEIGPELLQTAAKILLRYTRAEAGAECRMKVTLDGEENLISVVHEFEDPGIAEFRV